MCFYGFKASNSFVNRRNMWHMTSISMQKLNLTKISKFELFPSVSKIQLWVFSLLESTSSYTNKYPTPQICIFGYFSLRTWHITCIVFICGIATCSRYDVTKLIRPSLFSAGHDFKNPTLNPNISRSIYPFEEWYIHHLNRLVTAIFF